MITLQDGTQLDPAIVKVMKGLATAERDPNQDPTTQVGDNGTSTGIYQFHGDNWKNWAQQYLGDSNAPMTAANQNKLMYARIKAQKDAGLDPEEIAAIHNGAHIDKSTGKYTYNNPAYGEKFRAALGQSSQPAQPMTPDQFQQSLKNQPAQQDTTGTPTPGTPPADPNSIGSQIAGRGQQAMGALDVTGQGITSLMKGDVVGGAGHLVSGALQGAGALAGGVGDIATKVLEAVPGFKMLESVIGFGVKKLAETDAGKSVINASMDFAKQHPEIAKDVGAAFDIATVIPIFKGLGIAKNIAMDAATVALKDVAIKGAANSVVKVAEGVGGKAAQDALATGGKEAIQSMYKKNVFIDVLKTAKGTVYDTTEAMAKMQAEAEAQAIAKNAALKAGDRAAAQAADTAKLEAEKAMQMMGFIEGQPVQMGLTGKLGQKAISSAGAGIGGSIGGGIGGAIGGPVGAGIGASMGTGTGWKVGSNVARKVVPVSSRGLLQQAIMQRAKGAIPSTLNKAGFGRAGRWGAANIGVAGLKKGMSPHDTAGKSQ